MKKRDQGIRRDQGSRQVPDGRDCTPSNHTPNTHLRGHHVGGIVALEKIFDDSAEGVEGILLLHTRLKEETSDEVEALGRVKGVRAVPTGPGRGEGSQGSALL